MKPLRLVLPVISHLWWHGNEDGAASCEVTLGAVESNGWYGPKWRSDPELNKKLHHRLPPRPAWALKCNCIAPLSKTMGTSISSTPKSLGC